MQRTIAVALLVALLCVTAVACGGESVESTTTSTELSTTTTTEQTVAFPGSYLTSLTVKEVRSGGSEDTTIAGEWVFVFTESEDSAFGYVATLNGVRAWEGTIVLDGDQATVTTADIGRDSKIEGVYTWSFDGTELVFSEASDGLEEREIIFTTRPWVRQP